MNRQRSAKNRHRLALGLVAFLVALCLGAPLAFQAGWTRATRTAAPQVPYAKHFAHVGEAIGTRDFSDCYRNVRLPVIRQFDRIQDCRADGDGRARRIGAEEHGRQASSLSRTRPLRNALAAAIAGGGLPEPPILGSAASLETPYEMALAPGENAFGGGFSGYSLQLPGNLIPPGLAATFVPPVKPQGPSEPPAIETPLPGALPLLLTGLGVLGLGKGAASRRKAHRHPSEAGL